MNLTLPTDSVERKDIPLFSGVLKYAPAALAGMARISHSGNAKHNPGEPLHHARGKSNDHPDCIVRHTLDVADIIAWLERTAELGTADERYALLTEVSQLVWRAALWSQELHEKYGGAPLAPGARLPSPERKIGMMPELAAGYGPPHKADREGEHSSDCWCHPALPHTGHGI